MFEQKLTHIITHPEYCIVWDKVGGNASQKGDDHKWLEILSEKGCNYKDPWVHQTLARHPEGGENFLLVIL